MERGSTCFGARRRPRRTWEPISAAQSHFGYWVKRAELRVSAGLARKLEEWSIIPSEWAALREMYRPGRTSPIALARAIGMSKGGASKLIDRLVKKGFARKRVGRFDRRCRAVGLTRLGKGVVPHLAMLEDHSDSEFFGKLRAKARHYLVEALMRVAFARQDPGEYGADGGYGDTGKHCKSSANVTGPGVGRANRRQRLGLAA